MASTALSAIDHQETSTTDSSTQPISTTAETSTITINPRPSISDQIAKMPSAKPSSTTSAPRTLHIGTRRSALALAQTALIHTHLQTQHPSLPIEIHPMATLGDKNQTTALYSFAAKSLWTFELEDSLLNHSIDLIVHCLKDMPTQLPAGCALGAILAREESRDCVVMGPRGRKAGWKTLGDLPEGSVVGTSSVRRGAMVRRRWPGLVVRDVRGNVGTRLRKLDEGEEGEEESFACLILAAAGLQRLGLGERVGGFLSWREGGWLGAVGQGALALEVREGDEWAGELMEGLMGGEKEMWGCLAERSLLRTLEGGCSVPIGVETEWVEGERGKGEKDTLLMHAVVLSVDGQRAVEGSKQQKVSSREEADQFGWEMAQELVRNGAGKILEEITLNRKVIQEQGGA